MRNTSLLPNIVRLSGSHEFALRHPKPIETAPDFEQYGFHFLALQLLRFSLICDVKHVVHAPLYRVSIVSVAFMLHTIYGHITCRFYKAGSYSIRR
jgi:hypothetical protein